MSVLENREAAGAPQEKSVLIVDDEAMLALFMVDVFEELGYSVIGTAKNRQEAMALLEERGAALAVVDVELQGGESGISLAAEIKDRYRSEIMFLSGHSDIAENSDVQALRPCAVLQKPCMPEDIELALRSMGNAA